ncbi:hypothetical protein [Zunongwangia profunda]|uniref:hypothetical protein n=1 Tax=Zunongwangia profunda TaxID=398743 RepID=UPI00248D5F87|nr:hypothetical protein [Zunongwangia profunda]|tara:strand:- start:8651 stop:9046 length:396 start_codon:yes stop_codon:yes gene_type:complete
MKNQSIKISGSVYPLKFGYGAFRLLGRNWNCPGIAQVSEKVQQAFPEGSNNEVSFDQIDLIGDITYAGISNAGVSDIPDPEDIIQAIVFEDANQLSIVMNAFSESFPKEGNVQPRSKARQKATSSKPRKKN